MCLPTIAPPLLLIRASNGNMVPFLFLLPELRESTHEKSFVLKPYKEAPAEFMNSKQTLSNANLFKKWIAEMMCMARQFRKEDWKEFYEVGR